MDILSWVEDVAVVEVKYFGYGCVEVEQLVRGSEPASNWLNLGIIFGVSHDRSKFFLALCLFHNNRAKDEAMAAIRVTIPEFFKEFAPDQYQLGVGRIHGPRSPLKLKAELPDLEPSLVNKFEGIIAEYIEKRLQEIAVSYDNEI